MAAYNIRLNRGQPYRQCRDCMAARRWYLKNPERQKELNQGWVAANPDRARSVWRDMAKRKRESSSYMLMNRIRCGLSRSIRGLRKERATLEIVGYSVEDLRAHLERQFLKGMSWENMGQWHIDHIIPLASFTITGADDPELRRAWSLPNLRPLWAADNIRKHAKRETLL